ALGRCMEAKGGFRARLHYDFGVELEILEAGLTGRTGVEQARVFAVDSYQPVDYVECVCVPTGSPSTQRGAFEERQPICGLGLAGKGMDGSWRAE
ncbi:MAG: hypothetical protein WAL45_09350, partial [Terracidiphilus sp.]